MPDSVLMKWCFSLPFVFGIAPHAPTRALAQTIHAGERSIKPQRESTLRRLSMRAVLSKVSRRQAVPFLSFQPYVVAIITLFDPRHRYIAMLIVTLALNPYRHITSTEEMWAASYIPNVGRLLSLEIRSPLLSRGPNAYSQPRSC